MHSYQSIRRFSFQKLVEKLPAHMSSVIREIRDEIIPRKQGKGHLKNTDNDDTPSEDQLEKRKRSLSFQFQRLFGVTYRKVC